jgi:hypothetical protein
MKLDVDQKVVCDVPDEIIQRLLDSIEESDWHVSDYRNAAGNMSDTHSIPIMHTPLCASGYCDMRPIDDIQPEPLYEKFYPHVEPILGLLGEHYQFAKYAAFMALLKPRGVVGLHPDKGHFLELCHRIHVPLLTNPGVAYHIDGKEYYWQRGKAYEFDNTRVHGVFNRSDDPRIHLVINLYPAELGV